MGKHEIQEIGRGGGGRGVSAFLSGKKKLKALEMVNRQRENDLSGYCYCYVCFCLAK